jgi:hypothetical protein
MSVKQVRRKSKITQMYFCIVCGVSVLGTGRKHEVLLCSECRERERLSAEVYRGLSK